MADNLRAFTRIATALATEVKGAGGTAHGLTRDVALSGIFVVCPTPFPVGSTVSVVLLLGASLEEAHIAARGEVVRHEAGGMAIRFDELEGLESYDHLRNLVLLNSRDPERVERELESHVGLRPASP